MVVNKIFVIYSIYYFEMLTEQKRTMMNTTNLET